MNENTLKNLNNLTRMLGADRLLTPEDVLAIKEAIVGILATNKKEVDGLTSEVRDTVNSVLNKILDEHDTYLKNTEKMAQEVKSSTSEAVKQAMDEMETVKRLCKEVMESKPKDGEDADEEAMVADVLAQIKLPEYKEVILDDGGQIVDKINALPVNEENQIDASHIKNLPKVKSVGGGITQKRVLQLIQENGGAGVTLKVDGTNNVNQGILDLIPGSGITIVDNGDGTVTFTSTGGSGTGDVVGPASATDNAIARFDGTTGKLIQNSAATIADTSGNITAGTYNGNTIGAGSTSGTNTGDQTSVSGNAGTATVLQTARTIGTITGDATSAGSSFDGSANNTNALTLATVNSNVGSFGSATAAPAVTVNAKGLVTAVTTNTITPSVGSITGLGTGVGTALAVNVGTAGAFVTNGGALGTPSSGTVTNLTGTASININGTVGATTPTTGSFTTVTTSGNIELGNASDTTISRVSAGVAAIEGNNIVVNTSSPTLATITTTGNIELGNASDTTLSRSAAGQLAVEGVDVLTTSNTKTVTNKTLTTPVINGATLNGDLQTDGLPDTDDTWNGKSTNSFNAAGTIAQFDCVYMTSSSTWALTDADAIGTAGNVLVMMAGAAGTASNPLRVIEPGSWVRNDAWNWTVGGVLYLDTATPGGMTQTVPSGTDDAVKIVGHAVSADVIYFNPSVNWIIHV